MTDDAYGWKPVSGCWTVRPTGDGWRADWADPDPDPAPVTTIARRCWHVAVDCLDSYSSRLFGRTGTGLSGTAWVGCRNERVEMLVRAWENLRTRADDWSEADLVAPLGPSWAPLADHGHADLALHAARAVIHHGAEVALLMDLHRVADRTRGA